MDATTVLAETLLQIQPDRRSSIMVEAVTFRPADSLDPFGDVGEVRARFSDLWEQHFDQAVPIVHLRSVLEPPIPIERLIPFSKLRFAMNVQELKVALEELVGYLSQQPTQRQTTQLTLFESDHSQPPPRRTDHDGESVTDLERLVARGRRFPTVYADPPWNYENTASRGAAENHYPTMTLEEICAEPVSRLVTDNAHLHLWTTNAFLKDAFTVIDAWGFEFKSSLVWVKEQMGMGNYWRVSHEFLLLGVRGRLTFADRRLPSWIHASRLSHSRKPGIVRALIERASPGPYLELYGREDLPGTAWTVYGNQIQFRPLLSDAVQPTDFGPIKANSKSVGPEGRL